MAHLQHLKWPIAVRRQFILSLHGVSGVLIEYSAHNCRYFDFRPPETIILVILGPFFTLRITKSNKSAIFKTWNCLWQLEDNLYWVYMEFQVFWLNILLAIADILILYPSRHWFWPFWDFLSPLGSTIQEMGHLQHLKWPMAVRRPFILSLYGVSGVLKIEYILIFCS